MQSAYHPSFRQSSQQEKDGCRFYVLSETPKELGGKLAGKTLQQQVIQLAKWPLLEQLLALAVATVDLAIAGHLPPDETTIAAVDALGVTGFVGWLIAIINSSAGIGAAALVARAIGGKHKSLANSALAQAVLLGLCFGTACGLLVGFGAPVIASIVGLEGLSRKFAIEYLQIISLAAPANAMLLIGNACSRAAGDTRTPFVVMCLVNAVNIGFSLLFVYGPAPFGGMEVRGIALGTMIAWLVGAVVVFLHLCMNRRGIVRLRIHRLRPHWHTIQRIVRVGIPNLAESLGGVWIATFLVLAIVGRLEGEGLIGSHMITIRIEAFAFLPGFAIGTAASTLVGQYLGLGDPVRAKKAGIICWLYATAMMTVLGTLFCIFPRELAAIFTKSDLLIEQAVTPLRIGGAAQCFFATYIVLANALRGVGDTKTTMKLTYMSVFTVRLPGAFLLGHYFGLGLNGVWIALGIDMVLRGVLFFARFLHGGWTKVEV